MEAPPGSPLSAAPAFSSGAPALGASATTLFLFARAVGDAYPPNPYHNFAHALDVTHAAIRPAAAAAKRAPLAPNERAALVLAALCHDVGHPGVNNAFLVATRADVARVYNDTSVLEAASVARAYDVTARTPGGDIFAALPDAAAWRDVRRLFIAAILHTDMTHHFPMVSKVEVFVEMNAAALGLAKSGGGGGGSAPATTAPAAGGGATTASTTTPDASSSSDGLPPATPAAPTDAAPPPAARPADAPPLFASPDERAFLLAVLLHCADISNAIKPLRLAEAWAGRVVAEFLAQGDAERARGLPPSPMCDRATVSAPGSQVSFIDFVVAPLFHQVGWGREGGGDFQALPRGCILAQYFFCVRFPGPQNKPRHHTARPRLPRRRPSHGAARLQTAPLARAVRSRAHRRRRPRRRGQERGGPLRRAFPRRGAAGRLRRRLRGLAAAGAGGPRPKAALQLADQRAGAAAVQLGGEWGWGW